MADLPFDPEEFKRWDPKTQERVASALEAALNSERRAWYCKRGRSCDGKPHDGYNYPHARGDQWPPPGSEWLVWLAMAGRGWGKTRSGSEWTRRKTERVSRFALIGPTVSHVRDVLVEGESGIIRIFEMAGKKVEWEPSKRKITCPNGALIYTYSGEEPDRLRGPEHGAAWLDEPAHIPLIEALWDNLLLGLRLGRHPQIMCSTTPLPTKWMKVLVERPDTIVTRGATYENLDNLSPLFRQQVLEKYEGTRLGRQELHGEILTDVEGALWSWEIIEDNREFNVDYRDLTRIVVGIDPSGTSSKKRDETGIVVVGQRENHLYVLEDASGHYTPEAWAAKAWEMYDKYEADKIVAEKNYGGEMVLSTLRNSRFNQKGRRADDSAASLVHSRRGKALRAEPIVGLYEQERVHHTSQFTDLEEQMTQWVPGTADSPDRVDALVHACTDLAKPDQVTSIATPSRTPLRSQPGLRLIPALR